MPVINFPIPLRALLASIALALSACADDDTGGTPDNDTLADGAPAEVADVVAGNESYSIELAGGPLTVNEGGDALTIPLRLIRGDGHTATVQLQADVPSDGLPLSVDVSDAELDGDETSASLSLQLPIGPRPIQASDRTLTVTASDGEQDAVTLMLSIGIVPTSRPDIYVLAGQSNMLGFSEPDARQAGPGEPDAPDPRILQLNPTGNDEENFGRAADFTDPGSISAISPRLTEALDPLHDGFDVTAGGKPAEFIGPGLSFAKRALADTTSTIYLVPTAWSDTGFCSRETNILEGVGWNATDPDATGFSGTLLHDRAIARTNQTIAETGGILRGILWHQGEADSGDPDCADRYADNLAALAESLRTNIDVDARGEAARGPDADIPFIVGTMSRGSDARGSQLPFTAVKQQVDSAHRNVATLVPLSTFVNNDDLVPPAYPCGEGSCVHFGAAALREMGSRYYDALIGLVP